MTERVTLAYYADFHMRPEQHSPFIFVKLIR